MKLTVVATSASGSLRNVASSSEPAYLRAGIYDVNQHASFSIPVSTGDLRLNLAVSLTAPTPQPDTKPRSFPIVYLLSGFQLPLLWYKQYAHSLASWGYIVLQYDLPGAVLKTTVRDDVEILFIPLLLTWLAAQAKDPSTAVYEVADLRRVAAVGHSRGAKLAALALAGSVGGIQTAVLIDPVDMTSATRRMGYPSAVAALTADGTRKTALLIGAGLSGWCNPSDEGWRKFWPALATNSWLQVIAAAGHMQFTDAKGASGWAWDRFCGHGNVSHRAVIRIAASTTLAWLEKGLRGDMAEQPVADYLAWLESQAGAGIIQWEVKEEPALLKTAGYLATHDNPHGVR